MKKVAIIGAGPAGLACGRWLKKEGFEPVLFEQGHSSGGQWTADQRYSGVWPSMRTNTSRTLSSFSDLSYPAGTAVFPTNQQVFAYIQRYAEEFGLRDRTRTGTRAVKLAQNGAEWVVTTAGVDGAICEEKFARVVVATGRYHKPMVPEVHGLDSFTGRGGIAHTFEYKQPEKYRGMRVLVAGSAISALEIASDLAMLGAERVTVTNRRRRYVMQKMLGGIPSDHLAFTRFGALATETFPLEATTQRMKEFILRTTGSPEQFGAPKPAEDVFAAGITLSQNFLPLVAEGRIGVKSWMSNVQGMRVTFADGSSEEVDAIVFGTGFKLDLPFLGLRERTVLGLDDEHIDLHQFTFHPEAPALAFVGIMRLIGPYFPVLETQARWIAYTWSGAREAPSREEMGAGVAAYRARRGQPQSVPMNLVALGFARAAGVEPELERWPDLARALLFGPLSSVSFRLSGRDCLDDAARRVAEDAAEFGAVTSAVFTAEQAAQVQDLAKARSDEGLARMVESAVGRKSGSLTQAFAVMER